MDPTVVGAWIAACVSVLTLIGTVITQIIGFRVSSRDAEKTAEEQRKQLDRTLAEQRTRTLNERFATAAEQLGSDKPAVQLAGVYAMAGLADDWGESRQTCVDVLCAYLQLPYVPDPGSDAPERQRLAFLARRKVRHTIIRVITAHLKRDAAVSWQGLTFGFNGVVFDGGDFRDAEFSGGSAVFDNADFSSGTVSFSRAKFSGGAVYFGGAKFSGGRVRFADAEFSGSRVSFRLIELSAGQIDFEGTRFSGSTVSFHDARFSGGKVGFGGARFSGGEISFRGAQFSGGTVDFSAADDWSVPPEFPWAATPPSGVSLPEKGDQPTA